MMIGKDTRGISSALGSVLLVGIVVLFLALVVPAFLGSFVGENEPIGEFKIENTHEEVQITYWNGNPIESNELYIYADGDFIGTWSDLSGGANEDVRPGKMISFTLEETEGFVNIDVNWRSSQTGVSKSIGKRLLWIIPEPPGPPVFSDLTVSVDGPGNNIDEVTFDWGTESDYDEITFTVLDDEGATLGSVTVSNGQASGIETIDISNNQEIRIIAEISNVLGTEMCQSEVLEKNEFPSTKNELDCTID